MSAPTQHASDSQSITVSWSPVDHASSYTVEYRNSVSPSGPPCEWAAIPPVKGTALRKKNLDASGQYYFRVLPCFEDAPAPGSWAFSPPSEAMSLSQLPPSTLNLLGPWLVDAEGKQVSTAAALAGRTVGIYASASWCGPCRQFTPQLASFYSQASGLRSPGLHTHTRQRSESQSAVTERTQRPHTLTERLPETQPPRANPASTLS